MWANAGLGAGTRLPICRFSPSPAPICVVSHGCWPWPTSHFARPGQAWLGNHQSACWQRAPISSVYEPEKVSPSIVCCAGFHIRGTSSG